MKIYQVIYTSVKHCLSDPTLGLTNQEGYRVYSCSQGLTKEDLTEITRFSSYRLPKNNQVKYSLTPGDPSVPGKFPKTFRALRLESGKYAAIQSVYAGRDFHGRDGNFFAHALVFDEVSDSFFPEQYYHSPIFRTHLTKKEFDQKLVPYLPVLEQAEVVEGLPERVNAFIKEHPQQMSELWNQAAMILKQNLPKHICVVTGSEEESDLYLLALKWLLPRDVSGRGGISTYNVYLPSDKQQKVIFHASIEGKNNITEKSIETHTNCIYLDFKNKDYADAKKPKILDTDLFWLRKEYAQARLKSEVEFEDWGATFEEPGQAGIGGKLLKLKANNTDAFVSRAKALYPQKTAEEITPAEFEILKVMYDHIELFQSSKEELSVRYMAAGIRLLCAGEPYNMENLLKAGDDPALQARLLHDHLSDYFTVLEAHYLELDQKNALLLLRLFAVIKQTLEIATWKEFFKANKQYLSLFTELAAGVMITSDAPGVFQAPASWSRDEISEMVAYFESSTQDDALRKSCLKYIMDHEKDDWSRFGISLTKHTKTKGEQERDILQIRRMLGKVGYIPYQRNTYSALRQEVLNEMSRNANPLLLTRLLAVVYDWQASYGNQKAAQDYALSIRELLLEMRRTQTSCYNYIIPKLALELIETPGHYHELMINVETMPPSFWNWFLIGYKKSAGKEEISMTYQRIYVANKTKIAKLPNRAKIRRTFQNVK